MNYEDTARSSHRGGLNCAMAVYSALGGDKSNASKPRAEGGKCGAVLAAEKMIREKGLGDKADFEKEFLALFGSLKCSDLRGATTGKCNDYVGTASRMVGEMLS